MDVSQGDFVEIKRKRGYSLRYVGMTGYIQSVEGDKALVQLVDDTNERFTDFGEPMQFATFRLVKIPTPKQIEARSEERREKHFSDMLRDKTPAAEW